MPPAAGRSDTAVTTAMGDDHAYIHRRVKLLVTTVDELFGTHSVLP
jgi:hypothetical protein